jgi:hypothetical protein
MEHILLIASMLLASLSLLASLASMCSSRNRDHIKRALWLFPGSLGALGWSGQRLSTFSYSRKIPESAPLWGLLIIIGCIALPMIWKKLEGIARLAWCAEALSCVTMLPIIFFDAIYI